MLVAAVVLPVSALLAARPAAAWCDVACSATLTASGSPAQVGSTIAITLATGQSGLCFTLEASPSDGSAIDPQNDPSSFDFNVTGGTGGLDGWKVTYNGTPGWVVTYTALWYPNCGPSPTPTRLVSTQVKWMAPDHEQNTTITASPPVVIADGHSASTVSVSRTDFHGNAISGAAVTLTGADASATVTPATATTGAGGQAVFTVTSAQPASMTLGVSGGATSPPIPATAKVEFVPPDQAERALSSVDASLSRIPADGLSTTTVTATLKDISGPLAGRSVQLVPTAGSSVIMTPLASQTNAAGEIGFTISDSKRESVDFLATDTVSNLAVGMATVRFGDAPAGEQGKGMSEISLSPSGDVVTAATLPSDGTTAAAVYVQLLCNDLPPNGCNNTGFNMYLPTESGTVGGAKVRLVPTGPTSAVVSQILNPTNANGEARFLVTDSVPEDVTFNAVDITNNVEVASVDDSTTPPQVTPLKVTLSFKGPGTPSATNSGADASPTFVAADGVTASTITVTLRDGNRIPVPGKTVTLSVGQNHATFTPAQVVTDRLGKATFSTVDTHVETVSYLVTDVTDSIALTTLPQVTFTAGGPSSSVSTVAASPVNVPADGASKSTITVTLLDPQGNPLSGKTVSLSQGAGHSTVSAPSGPTDSSGVTTFTAADGTPEVVTYTARDETDGFDLTHTTAVTFIGNPTSDKSTISADPASVPANSLATSTVTVTLRDQNGSPVAGKRVKLNPQNGVSSPGPLAPGSDISNQNGVATFAVTDSSQEKVTYNATDSTDAISLAATTTVAFTGPPSGATSTVVANPTSVAADGVTKSTITVTLLDGASQPIPGQNITLTASSGTHSSIGLTTPGSNTTNAAGVATFTASDTNGETVTYTAADVSVSPPQQVFATAQVTFVPTPTVSSISPSYGPSSGGTKVTISGTNLSRATAVKFGSTTVSSVSINKKNGSVTVTSPAGTGIVDVVVVTPAGPTPVTPADKFRYAPAVTGVSPSSGTQAGGTKVTISGTNFTSVDAVYFGATKATIGRTSDTSIVVTAPPGLAGTVDITVHTPGGTSDLNPSDRYSYV